MIIHVSTVTPLRVSAIHCCFYTYLIHAQSIDGGTRYNCCDSSEYLE